MSAQLNYEACPSCGEIRNCAGMKTHIKRKHPVEVSA